MSMPEVVSIIRSSKSRPGGVSTMTTSTFGRSKSRYACARSLAADDVRHARDAADVHDRFRRTEAEARVGLRDLKVVRIKARVDVGRMEDGQVHLTVQLRRLTGILAARRREPCDGCRED